MVEIIEPNAPTITIKIMRGGQFAINVPDDKILALGMLSAAIAIVQKDLINPAHPMMVPPANGKLS